MTASTLVKYHVVSPLGLFLVLVVAGAPLGSALVLGMMSGCISMVIMMMRHGSDDERDGDREHRHDRH